MASIRLTRILILVFGAGIGVVVAGHEFFDKRGQVDTTNVRLEERARTRFENGGGLSPCDGDMQRVLAQQRSRLRAMGEYPELVIVVAPTFSGAKVVALGKNRITSLHFAGESGFMPPTDWLASAVVQKRVIELSASEYFDVFSPIARHVRYAMTARRYGLDGVSYYFGSSEDECAFAWSPRGQGPAAAIADWIAEATSETPSHDNILALARTINRVDESQ